MAQSEHSLGLPWGSLVTIVGLAVVGGVRLSANGEMSFTAPLVMTGIVAMSALFVIERGAQFYLWGVVAALLLVEHPIYREQLRQAPANVALASALGLATLAGIVVGWLLVMRERFEWRSWLALLLGLSVSIGLAWVCLPTAGSRAAWMTLIGLVPAVVLPWRLIRQVGWYRPASANLIAAVGCALLAGPLGYLLALGSKPLLAEQFPALVAPSSTESMNGVNPMSFLPAPPFAIELTEEQWRQIGWPNVWVVCSIVLWASWRGLRRGWSQWRRAQAPIAWLLLGYALWVVALLTSPAGHDLTLALLTLIPLVVLLTVFWVADLLRLFGERLMLRPPEERT